MADSWPARDALHGCLMLQDWDTGAVPLSFGYHNYNFTFNHRNSIESLRELTRSNKVSSHTGELSSPRGELCAHMPLQPRRHAACRPATLWESWCCAALQYAC